MTDRELLELAAKAAGITKWDHTFVDAGVNVGSDATPAIWNPLTDDGDALRLAVKCSIYIQPFTEACTPSVFARSVNHFGTEQVIPLGEDHCAAVRRAIVRAAAAIGKELP